MEIARLLVGDYLTEDGLVREESVLRADTAINGKERPIFFASRKVVAAVDAYLEERVRRGQGTGKRTKYRGLDPDCRLVLTGDGHAMPIKVRAINNRRQYRCGVILDIYRRIFARAGLKGVSALSARRTIAEKLFDRGCDVSQIGALLGLKERNAVRNLIQNEMGFIDVHKRDGLCFGERLAHGIWRLRAMADLIRTVAERADAHEAALTRRDL